MAFIGWKRLQDGNEIPELGVGTFKLRSQGTEDLVEKTLSFSIENGYRLIDTASCYRNENDIGRTLKKCMSKYQLSRNDFFLTSKLAPKDLHYNGAIKSFQDSLSELDCKYIDLYLIHWPGRVKHKLDDPKHRTYRQEAWQALEELQIKGYVKSIGVSNYTLRHLKEMQDYASVTPAVNQVEFHPHLYQKDLLNYCNKAGIFLQAYSSLGSGQLLDNKAVNDIANEVQRTPAQVLLKWGLQHGVGVIPKSTNPCHIKDNLAVSNFFLSTNDMEMLNSLNINKHYCWDPNTVA